MVRQRPGSSEVPDAVIIGAGHNGLVAANILADAGWSVLVLEAAGHAGGAVHSAESVRPGFVTDLYSAFYPLGAASPVLNALELERYGLSWSHAPSVLAHVLPDERCALLCRDVAGIAGGVRGRRRRGLDRARRRVRADPRSAARCAVPAVPTGAAGTATAAPPRRRRGAALRPLRGAAGAPLR